MIGFLITGHGNFASGILSSIKVIAGEQPCTIAVDFNESDSSELLTENIEQSIKELNCNSIICFCDIAGGSPYRTCALLTSKFSLSVISGANMPMILSCLFERENSIEIVEELAIKSGIESIFKYETKEYKQQESEEGI